MKSRSNLPLGVPLALLIACAAALAQVSPLLHLESIQVTQGGPVQFTFADAGTGSTNYLVEFAPSLGVAWSNVSTAAFAPLGAGRTRVTVPNPLTAEGFYRVRGVGGAIVASFASTGFQVTEGGMVAPTITFSAPFSGIVRYTVSGTAQSGDYLTLSGEVSVNGTTASIPVTLTDNLSIGTLRHLTLTLFAGLNAGYRIGSSAQSTITIEENDSEWHGSFVTDDATIGFVLKIQQSGATLQSALKSGGSGFFPTNEVPASVVSTANSFSASVLGIPLPANVTALNLPLNLTFLMSALNGQPNQSVSPALIQGAATLVTEVSGRPHLNITNQGTFLLLRSPSAPSTNEVELVNAP